MYTKNTKIVCTLGPSSESVEAISNMILAGMNIARLNFSHGDYKNHAKLIKNIRKAEKITGHTIGIMQDLQGPKIRVGEMPEEGIEVKNGKIISITNKKIPGQINGKEIIIPIKYENLLKDIKKDHSILINDGLIEVKTIKINKNDITAKVIFGGTIKKGNGVNFPHSSVTIPTITEKDKQDLKFGMKHKVDFIALSFVKSPKDISDLRKLINTKKNDAAVIAKLERHEVIKNLRAIIKAADGIMVARGDLGTDIPAEQVPIVQKRMISIANRYGKPVITATHVLQSMVTKARATRAEISDAANAVFDHTDAIMLSNETAVGKYPVKATTTLTKVASTVEKELAKNDELVEHTPNQHLSQLNASALNSCEIAQDIGAHMIVVYTTNGYTARQVAKHRLYIPIITITPNKKIAKHLTLVWGINKVLIKKFAQKDTRKAEKIIKLLKQNKLATKGHKVVIICNASSKENLITTTEI